MNLKYNIYYELYKDLPEDSIGSLIKKYRVIKIMTQQQLADKVGVNRSTINDYEWNLCIPSKNILIDLEKVLEIAPIVKN